MKWKGDYRPRLRPLEAFPLAENEEGVTVGLRDPGRLSEVVLTLSPAALQVLAMMDGDTSCDRLRMNFYEKFGQPLGEGTLSQMLDHLERAHFLEGDAFEAHYRALTERYRSAGVRDMHAAAQLGITDPTGTLFERMLDGSAAFSTVPARGLIAPHLDYPRGRPCYARAYGAVRERRPPDRVVVLGTNHFGRSASVVATGCDFRTPLGLTRTDRDFLEGIEARCGELRRFELDHLHEHSVELQVAWLQHLFGAERFRLAAFLCPDPCGPTGTAPADGSAPDLADFADALGAAVRADDADTLIVAGADFSHVGGAFGDERALDDVFLEEVRVADETALSRLAENDPEGFRSAIAQRENVTRICSAGCIYTLARALPDATPEILGYHQAVDSDTQTCVTCAAAVFT